MGEFTGKKLYKNIYYQNCYLRFILFFLSLRIIDYLLLKTTIYFCKGLLLDFILIFRALMKYF